MMQKPAECGASFSVHQKQGKLLDMRYYRPHYWLEETSAIHNLSSVHFVPVDENCQLYISIRTLMYALYGSLVEA